MSELKTLSVKKRTAFGKGANRRLRTEALVPGVYYTADGSCYTYTYEGLDPASQYRLAISHDSPSYVVSGQFSVSGLATATQSDEELDEENA